MMRLLAGLLAAALIATPALAATTPNSVVTPQTPNEGRVQFLQGTDTAGTYKTLYTASANGSVCFGMEMTNSEASTTHLVTIQIVNTAVKFGGTVITTVAGSGFAAATPSAQSITSVPAVAGVWNTLPVDGNGNGYIQLVSGDTIQATFATAFVTTGAVINLRVACNDF